MESLLAVALTLRGARVHTLLCDELLPACSQAMVHQLPATELLNGGLRTRVCRDCFIPANNMYTELGLPTHRYSDFLTGDEHAEAHSLAVSLPAEAIAEYRWHGLAVGEHALAGALRYFARGTLAGVPNAQPVLRRYFEASLLTVNAIQRLFDEFQFERACFHHGIYVPQGLIGELARHANVPLVNWAASYRKQTHIFSHGDTYHHTLLAEPTDNWDSMPWTPEMEAAILAYLKSRWQGTRDWIWFHENPQEDFDQIAANIGLDLSRPFVGMLTNVMWDAQLHYPANAFPNMLDWVLRTIAYFAQHSGLQLVIRIHPAELRGTIPSQQPLAAEIRTVYPVVPPNVFVIGPESPVSTYAAMMRANAILIYGTKMGVELTSLGIPTIVAGEAWIRNKGLTMDAHSVEEYLGYLDQLPLPSRLSEEVVRRARKYAYHFFLRRMIPLEMIEQQTSGWPFKVNVNSLDELAPGHSLGLDVICDGILNGREFIYPAERVGVFN